LLSARNQYEITKIVFENLDKNFDASGQIITSPQSGFIQQVFIKNGAYVEAGQPIALISQNKSMTLTAEIPVKFASDLSNIKTAIIRNMTDGQTYTLEELSGKVVSFGKAANNESFLLPVNMLVENNGSLVSGSFVEVFLKTASNSVSITVPNEALIEEQGVFFVWVQVHPELFEKREVRIGSTDGMRTAIKNGISTDERIVIRGAMLIKLAQATGSLDAHSGHVH
jgi:RND family efflux transporter MFP subunit